MAIFVGDQEQVAVGIEGTAGTLASTLFWIPLAAMPNFGRGVEEGRQTVAIGTRDSVLGKYIIREMSSGTLRFYCGSVVSGLALAGIFGAKPTPTGTAPARIHSYSISDTSAEPVTLSIVRKNPNVSEQFTGCRITRATFEFMGADMAMLELDFIGNKAATWSGSVGTILDSDALFSPSDTKFKIASTLATAKSVASGITDAKTLTVTFDQNVTGYSAVGTDGYAKILAGTFKTEINTTAIFESTTHRTTWLDASKDFAYIKATGDRNLTTSGTSAKPILEFEFNNTDISSYSNTSNFGAVVEESFLLMPTRVGSTKSVAAKLTNNTASY